MAFYYSGCSIFPFDDRYRIHKAVTGSEKTADIISGNRVTFSGRFVQLLQSEFEQAIGSSSRPTHALAFEPAADGEINVLLHCAGPLHADPLRFSR